MVVLQLEILKILKVLMDLFKKEFKIYGRKGETCSRIIAMVLLLSFFKQIDQHLCVKFAKNKNLIY